MLKKDQAVGRITLAKPGVVQHVLWLPTVTMNSRYVLTSGFLQNNTTHNKPYWELQNPW